eukprot:13000512-Alexandrium_andersonii.AAC.1
MGLGASLSGGMLVSGSVSAPWYRSRSIWSPVGRRSAPTGQTADRFSKMNPSGRGHPKPDGGSSGTSPARGAGSPQ